MLEQASLLTSCKIQLSKKNTTVIFVKKIKDQYAPIFAFPALIKTLDLELLLNFKNDDTILFLKVFYKPHGYISENVMANDLVVMIKRAYRND